VVLVGSKETSCRDEVLFKELMGSSSCYYWGFGRLLVDWMVSCSIRII